MSTIDSNLITLIDHWPGVAWPGLAATHATLSCSDFGHNVAQPQYTPGTKIQLMCQQSQDGALNGVRGPSTLVYLQAISQGSNTASIDVKDLVMTGSTSKWYQVTNNSDVVAASAFVGLAACAIGPIADDNYGWFWCGGVVPEQYISAMGGNFVTNDDVVAGPMCVQATPAGNVCAFAPLLDDQSSDAAGWALAADA